MSEYIHKSHNVSVLLYHLVCPAKYRRVIFSDEVDKALKDICLEISKRHEIQFLVLIQSIPTYSPKKIVQTLKSITAREILKRMPDIKQMLWGGEFWSKGYFINTVGKHASEETIKNYIKEQGKAEEYKILHKEQLSLF